MDESKLHGFVELSNDEYHAGPGISNSHLTVMGVSPLHYWASYIDPNRVKREVTGARVIGDCVHRTVLEPDLFEERYAVIPEGLDRRTKEGKAAFAKFESENLGKVYVSHDARVGALNMAAAIRRHPVAGPLFRDGKAEQSFFCRDAETGALRKCRIDFLRNSGMMVDLKTCEDASPAAFVRSIATYRYFVQAPWYKDIMTDLGMKMPFVFIAIEKSPPHAIGVYYLDGVDEEYGRQIGRRDLRSIVECKEKNLWPDFGIEPMALKLPAWVRA